MPISTALLAMGIWPFSQEGFGVSAVAGRATRVCRRPPWGSMARMDLFALVCLVDVGICPVLHFVKNFLRGPEPPLSQIAAHRACPRTSRIRAAASDRGNWGWPVHHVRATHGPPSAVRMSARRSSAALAAYDARFGVRTLQQHREPRLDLLQLLRTGQATERGSSAREAGMVSAPHDDLLQSISLVERVNTPGCMRRPICPDPAAVRSGDFRERLIFVSRCHVYPAWGIALLEPRGFDRRAGTVKRPRAASIHWARHKDLRCVLDRS